MDKKNGVVMMMTGQEERSGEGVDKKKGEVKERKRWRSAQEEMSGGEGVDRQKGETQERTRRKQR